MQNFSLMLNTLPPSNGLINKYPNKPGKINRIEVEPVDPTNAKTCSKDVTVTATKYDNVTMQVVMT